MHAPKRDCCALAVWGLFGAAQAVAQPTPGQRLAELSLEELSNIEITSVSKRAERLSDAPTSVYVITADDIRRSGVTSLPEALRLAPNLQVARTHASDYAVSARGFNSSTANKLLVLIDGRSIYTPLYSGVFWDVQNVMLEDIDRIEVISGPGGTLWGVNAVNGVINVITRNAAASQGGVVAASAGRREAHASARLGATTGDGLAWRLQATGSDWRDSETADGTRVNDAGHLAQLAWRADAQRGVDRFMLQAEAYWGRRDQAATSSDVQIDRGPITTSGAHVLGQWERQLSNGASIQLQAYVDRTKRSIVPILGDTQDTLDLQFQHSLGSLGTHTPVWGLQYRTGEDRVDNSVYIAFLPARLRQTWASLFAQDEIALADDLHLTLGARAEHNDYTGVEFLPTARLAWKWAPQQLLWAAASHTVRAPSRIDRDAYVPGQPPYQLRGGADFESEVANVFELGYRGQPAHNATLSATAFHAQYNRLRTLQYDFSVPDVVLANGMEGTVSGLELWGSLQVSPGWRLHAGFSRLWQELRLKPGSNDATAVATAEGANPAYWWTLRSSLDLGGNTELDLALRQVAALHTPEVPRYTTLDLRLGWRPRPNLDLSLAAHNLLGNGHGEFDEASARTQFTRALLARAEWRF